jgi:hypothetical protein
MNVGLQVTIIVSFCNPLWKMFKMHCIQQILAFHRFKMLESQGRVKAGVAKTGRGSSKKGSKDPQPLQTAVPSEGGSFANPINRKLSFECSMKKYINQPFCPLFATMITSCPNCSNFI